MIRLHDLVEIRQLWGVGVDAVYRAAARGSLHAFGRPGRQKYYSEAELTAVFGPVKHRPEGGDEAARPSSRPETLGESYRKAA